MATLLIRGHDTDIVITCERHSVERETKTERKKMNQYEVTKRSGEVVTVDAKNEFSAVAKAHTQITGEKATSKDVTWHGVHAECKAHKYNKPVLTWSGK